MLARVSLSAKRSLARRGKTKPKEKAKPQKPKENKTQKKVKNYSCLPQK
jgi:hypothetical protein